MIEQIFTNFRKVSIIAVLASVLGSLLMFIIGAVKVARAYHSYYLATTGAGDGLAPGAGLAIAYVVQAIDAFLIALVLMIFGYGVYVLVVANQGAAQRAGLAGFKFGSITELKKILADMIVIILMVKFLEYALINTKGLEWEALVLPAATLMLAAAVRVLRLRE